MLLLLLLLLYGKANYKKAIERTNEILMLRACGQQVPCLSGKTKSCFKVSVGVPVRGLFHTLHLLVTKTPTNLGSV